MADFTTVSRRARPKFIARFVGAVTVLLVASTTISHSIAVGADPEPNSDSLLLAKHVKELKVEYALEKFSDHSFNSGCSDQAIDSILAEYRISFPSSKFVYSPDSVFKIAVVQGEGCGAYCNHFWESWFHFNDGSGLMLSKPGFENVVSIEKMDDGKYLVWESTYGRSGARGYYTETVTLLSISGHEINYFPFRDIPSEERMGETNNKLGSFSVYQTTDGEDELICDFNLQTHRLVYQYRLDEAWLTDDDTCEVFAGSFLYKDGQFLLENETCKTKRPQ